MEDRKYYEMSDLITELKECNESMLSERFESEAIEINYKCIKIMLKRLEEIVDEDVEYKTAYKWLDY